MEPGRAHRRYVIAEQPLAPGDYDVPIGWWGWNWDPPVPMSITELVRAGNMDTRTAALCWMVIEAHGSLLIAGEQPHSGKTTTLTALLDFLPHDVRRIFVRGWSETFDFLTQTRPQETLLLVNELSSHLPVYLWGPKAVRTFATLRDGYAIGSTLHADSADEAIAQLVGELGVPAADLGRVELLMITRIYGLARGGLARRVVTLHRLSAADGDVTREPLVTHDASEDAFAHDRAAEERLLATLRHEEVRRAAEELERRATLLDGLIRQGTTAIPEVRVALAADRGDHAPVGVRGDPLYE